MRRATRLLHDGFDERDPYHSVSPPLYQTATFEQASATEWGEYDYSRSGNPTRDRLEHKLAVLESGDRGFAFGSGMAAISTLLQTVETGARVLAGSDLYGGSYRLLGRLAEERRLQVEFVAAGDLAALANQLAEPAALVLLESPGNPFQSIWDLRAAARICQAADTPLAVDNTMLSPFWQNPLELGATVVIHSATKFLSGHSDLTAGALIVKDPALAERLAFLQNSEGNALAPFEAWLLLRGIQTLGVRLVRQQKTARLLVRHLSRIPWVRRLHYSGLPTHPGYLVQRKQARGCGSVFALELDSAERARDLVEQTRCFTNSVSFGSCHSQVSLPRCMSHSSVPDRWRSISLIPEELVRISVGLEHLEDLIHDLEQASGVSSPFRHAPPTASAEQDPTAAAATPADKS